MSALRRTLYTCKVHCQIRPRTAAKWTYSVHFTCTCSVHFMSTVHTLCTLKFSDRCKLHVHFALYVHTPLHIALDCSLKVHSTRYNLGSSVIELTWNYTNAPTEAIRILMHSLSRDIGTVAAHMDYTTYQVYCQVVQSSLQ